MACEKWRGKIEAYADAGLSREEMRAFEAHLRSCPSCGSDALAGVQWKRAVQNAGKRYTPSAEFRARIAKQVSSRKRPAWFGAWLPRFALAAVVVIGVGVFAQRWLASQEGKTFSELADLHVGTIASAT